MKNKEEKNKWQTIGYESWDLAREATKQKEINPYDWIWNHVEDYHYNSYETGILGEWACDNAEKILKGNYNEPKEKI